MLYKRTKNKNLYKSANLYRIYKMLFLLFVLSFLHAPTAHALNSNAMRQSDTTAHNAPTHYTQTAPYHFGLNVGFGGFFAADTYCKYNFGATFRYEYEYGKNLTESHRVGITAYYHPHWLYHDNMQYISFFMNAGSRLYENGQNGFVDFGIIFFPQIHLISLSLTQRIDVMPHANIHTTMLSTRIPLGILIACFAQAPAPYCQ